MSVFAGESPILMLIFIENPSLYFMLMGSVRHTRLFFKGKISGTITKP